jgi:hypothetical protein
VLTGRDLVVHVLDGDAHALQVLDRALAVPGRDVERRQVEVAAAVEELGALARTEVEVFELGTDVEREPEVRRPLELALQDLAGVAVERRAVGLVHVAEHARHAGLAGVGDQLERGRVGHGHHVGFLDAAEALDRRAVEAHALAERPLQLLWGDGEGLQDAQDVGEPQADELDPAFLGRPQDVVGFVRQVGHSGKRLHSWVGP